MMKRRGLKLLATSSPLVVAMLSSATHASADTPSDAPGDTQISGAEVTLAETLYREGRRLMSEQRYQEACGKFAESHRLDPATGTLLNLATCHEALGKLASAWLEFGDAIRVARREQREDRVRFAEEHIKAIEPRLSRLTITVAPTSGAQVQVKLDGFVIGPAAYGLAAPIDPGKHRIEAAAEGHKPWATEIVVKDNADLQSVSVPALEPEPAKPVASEPSNAVRPVTSPTEPILPTRPIPTSVYISGGATLALTAAGVVTGAVYLSRKKKYEDAAVEDPDAKKRAQAVGYVNIGLYAGALIGAGVTALLYVTRPEQRSGSTGPRLSAWVLPKEGGLSFSSEF